MPSESDARATSAKPRCLARPRMAYRASSKNSSIMRDRTRAATRQFNPGRVALLGGIGQQPDAQPVGVHAVVGQDRLVIGVDEEPSPPGVDQRRVDRRCRQPCSSRCRHAQLPPSRQGQRNGHLAFGQAPGGLEWRRLRDLRVGGRRDLHFPSPGLPLCPAVRRRGSWRSTRTRRAWTSRCRAGRRRRSPARTRRKLEGMNCGCPSAPAHEPRSAAELDVVAVEDLQRAEQLLAEHRRAARIVGECRQASRSSGGRR